MASTPAVLDSSSEEETTSLLYAVLPPLIRRSVPKVRSLRRSLGRYNSSAYALVGHIRSDGTDGTRPGSATPPPPYHDTVCPPTAASSDDESPRLPRARRDPLGLPPSVSHFAEDERAGIRWEFASQGLNLLTLSARGSTCLSSNPAFSRQLYIDSVSYLLRGLPVDLNDEEKLRLQAAIPSDLIQAHLSIGGVVLRDQPQGSRNAPEEEEFTLLQRTVAMIVLQFFLLFSFLWPYIQEFCRGVYAYERDYHISEKVLAHSWSTANAISKNTLTIAKTVCSWNDGQVGAALEDVVFWWVQGVTGGLREGVMDGMEVLGVKAIDQRGKRPAWKRA